MFSLAPTLARFRRGMFSLARTLWISRWEALQGPEWWFAGLYGAPCRKPLAPPNADLAIRALCRQDTQLFFEFLCFPQHLHFPDSGMGRYSRVWNGGFQAFAARLAGNPLAPKCRPCHLSLMQTTPYSPSTIMLYLPPTLPGFRDGEGLQGLEWWFAGLNADLADKTPGNP